MQITKFLAGDEQARLRPSNAIAPQVDLIEFIQNSVSHISLTRIALNNPDIWNSDEIGAKEQELIQDKCNLFIEQHGKGMPKGINVNNIETFIPTSVKDTLLPFFTEWLSLIHKAHHA
jgi:hypothetical protein